MIFFEKFLKYFFYSELGKPLSFYKIFFLDTHKKYVHNWISKSIDKNDIILDIGANKFPYTKYLRVKSIFGIDLPSESQGYLGWTKEKIDKILRKKIIYPIWANCEQMPFANNSFNKIFMIEVLEHLEQDELALSEVSRILTKKGKFFLSTPNGDEVENINPYHLRHYNQKSLGDLLDKYFNIVTIRKIFPNKKLFIKQYSIKKKFSFIGIFWKIIYDLWFYCIGKNYSYEEYTLIAECSYPKRKFEKEIQNSKYFDIVVCPDCKGRLIKQFNNTNTYDLYCRKCKEIYQLELNIPFLINKIFHHQKGPLMH